MFMVLQSMHLQQQPHPDHMTHLTLAQPSNNKEMKILATLPASILVHVGVIETLSTVLLCYALAVSYGHVPIWLPMISDCAIEAPEKYPFRLGIIIGGFLLAVQAVITYNANKSSQLATTRFALALIASAGLAVVGAVNSKEDNTVHSCKLINDIASIIHLKQHIIVFVSYPIVCALTFFIGYDIYALLTVYAAWYDDKVSTVSFVIRSIFAFICNCCLAGDLTISKIVMLLYVSHR